MAGSALALLRAVVPSGGYHYLVQMNEAGRPRHRAFRDLEEVVPLVQSMGDANIFFAVASFKVGYVTDERGVSRAVRKAENVDRLRCLFLDVDFKDYHDGQSGALRDLSSFINASGLPYPTHVVGTGGGLHIYWALSEDVPKETWSRMAAALAAATRAHGFKVDAHCTTDAARILRLPGTKNYKYSPARVCKLLHAVETPVATASMMAALSVVEAPARMAADGQVVELLGAYQTADDLSGGLETDHGPRTLAYAVPLCAVLSDAVTTGGAEHSYPLWKNLLHLAVFAEDGDALAHRMSEKHPGYSPETTDEKLEESRRAAAAGVGPTRCVTFSDLSPLCRTCPFFGRITTPLQLATPPAEDQPVHDDTKPPTFVANDRTWTTVGDGEPIMCCPVPLDEWSVYRGDEGGYHMQIRAVVAPGVSDRLDFPAALLADRKLLRQMFFNRGIPMSNDTVASFVFGASSWLDRLRRTRASAPPSTSCGWLEDGGSYSGFVVGDTAYMKDGKLAIGRSAASSRGVGVKGSMEPWRWLVDRLLKDPRPEVSILLATAFAAPLIRMSHVPAVAVSIRSAESGVGKTSTMNVAKAVWGDPILFGASLDDTQNAIMSRLASTVDLPNYWDEVRASGDQMRAFTSIVFRVTQGREKQRLTASLEARAAPPVHTMLVAGTNYSLMAEMEQMGHGSDAGIRRLLEIYMRPLPEGVMDVEFAGRLASLATNHGHAGHVYAETLARNPSAVEKRFRDVQEGLVKALSAPPEERFWTTAAAALLCGAMLARDAGLGQFEIQPMGKLLSDVIASQRRRGNSMETGIRGVPARIAEVFVDALSHILVTRGAKVVRVPERHLYGQLDLATNTLRIPRAAFGTLCESAGVDPRSLAMALDRDSMMRFETTSIGAGTPFSRGRVSCVVFDALAVFGKETLEDIEARSR